MYDIRNNENDETMNLHLMRQMRKYIFARIYLEPTCAQAVRFTNLSNRHIERHIDRWMDECARVL